MALITSFRDLKEAISISNNRRYGLDAAIFGKDINRIRRLIRLLEVGVVYINEYPRRWRENKRILRRIHSFHLKARRIAEDFARKAGKWVVDVARITGANAIKLENLRNLIKNVEGV